MGYQYNDGILHWYCISCHKNLSQHLKTTEERLTAMGGRPLTLPKGWTAITGIVDAKFCDNPACQKNYELFFRENDVKIKTPEFQSEEHQCPICGHPSQFHHTKHTPNGLVSLYKCKMCGEVNPEIMSGIHCDRCDVELSAHHWNTNRVKLCVSCNNHLEKEHFRKHQAARRKRGTSPVPT